MKKIFLKKRKKIFIGKNKIKKERNEIKNQKETTISFIKEKYPFLPNNENMLDNYNFIQYNNFKLPRIPFDNFYKINFDELFKKINLDNSFSKNYICNIQNNNDIKKHPHSYQISPLTPNNTIENIFDKSEIIIDIKNDDIEEKKFESNNNLLNISNNSNSNFIDINNITKIESKKKKYKSKRNIFKLYDKNKKLICKKRGKKPLSKRKSNIHTAEDEDNILRKIQVHFLTFLVSFTNDYLDTIYSNVKKKYIPHFKGIDYTIKRIISHDSIEKMKVLTIGEILQKRASPKNKSCDNNNINKVIYNNLCEQCPQLKENYFNKLFKEFFIEYYYNKNEQSIIINGVNVNLSPRTKTFHQLILKNLNIREKFKKVASYFYTNNMKEKNEFFKSNKDEKEINKSEKIAKPLFIIDN